MTRTITRFSGPSMTRIAGSDFDREVVDLARLAGRCGEDLEVRARQLGAVDGEHDVVGGHRAAVVEEHAAAQVEAPHRGALRLPRCRERWNQRQVLGARGEAL